jgi:hypothetical protein
MNYVQQAFSISEQHKAKAKELYIESVKELVGKRYTPATDDAFVDLSAIFGVRWLLHRGAHTHSRFDMSLYAEANTAFNYASMHYCKPKAFIALAKKLVPAESRISDRQLRKVASQMNYLLTVTTPELIRERARIPA